MPSVLLSVAFLVAVAVAGGASRADVLGQAVVRTAGIAVLVVAALTRGFRPRHAPLWLLTGAVAALLVVELIPLPPALWHVLPGRDVVRAGDALLGGGAPWRPMSLAPSATRNALFAMIVPFAVLAILSLGKGLRGRAGVDAALALALGSSLVALAQISGATFDNPFINENVGVAAGFMANRNHQALLLAIGIVVAPAWAMARGRGGWHRLAAVAAVLWLLLMILATGSRAGLGLAALALAAATGLAWPALRRAAAPGARSGTRRRVVLAVSAVIVAAVAVVAWAVAADRGELLHRLIELDTTQDIRVRALPTLWRMAGTYFPIGAGGGAFEPVFRMHEPLALLKPTFFNHAHDDFIEPLIEHGLAALLIALAAAAWLLRALRVAWRGAAGMETVNRARTGAAVIGLMLAASAVDYPLRTPLLMTLLLLAASWLCDGEEEQHDMAPDRTA